MPRYKLFLLERPSGDARTIQRATWELPSALDVGKLGKALKGEIQVDWLEIASSDRKRDILKIQHELARHGCMLAIDDAGGTLTKDLTGAIRQALSREGRHQSRERARTASIWERGEGWRAIPVWLARHARAIVSTLAAVAVLVGSVALLAIWMNAAPRAGGGGGPDASALDRLAAFSRGDANLPAIPDSADGPGGVGEPGEPVARGGARPLPTAEPDGGRPAIPDVPSGGTSAAGATVPRPKRSEEASNDTRSIEIAGFAVGIGWSALVEALARRGTRRSGSRSRAVAMRLVPAAVAGGLTVSALIAMDARTAPARHAAPTAKSNPTPPVAGPASRHEAKRKPPALARRATAPAATRHVAPSYRALVAALAPAPDPCAQASGSFARFLCLEHLQHPDAAAAAEAEEAAAQLSESGTVVAPDPAPRRGARPASDEAAVAHGDASKPPAPVTAPAKAATGIPVATRPTPATAATAPGLASAPSAPAPAALARPTPTSQVSTAAPRPPPTAAQPPPPPAPEPAVAARRDLLAALPTFLLGLLAGTLGLAIIALGLGSGTAKEASA